MLSKIIIIAFLIAILTALGSSLYYMLKNQQPTDDKKVVKALTWRIGLSLTLFILLLVGFATGIINPHRVSVSQPVDKHEQN